MRIERMQVEEGFLDGLDIEFKAGLNVLIGARGTGKTSVIELIRYCLDVPNSSPESARRSAEHALSILGSGAVTLTISDGKETFLVSRTAQSPGPEIVASKLPIIFSQTEIETVGLRSSGRLALVDGFLSEQNWDQVNRQNELVSRTKSLTQQIEAYRQEISELETAIAELPSVDQRLADLAPREKELAKNSKQSAERAKEIHDLSASLAAISSAQSAVERYTKTISEYRRSISSPEGIFAIADRWPSQAGPDLLAAARKRLEKVSALIQSASHELAAAEAETKSALQGLRTQRLEAEDRARKLRGEVEALKAGAGELAKQGQVLRERRGQLQGLIEVRAERQKEMQRIVDLRAAELDELDNLLTTRCKRRNAVAKRLNERLGPRIRLTVTQGGDATQYSAAISEALRGSGLRYNELAPLIASKMSPRELLEAIDADDEDAVSAAVGISRDRALRLLAQLRSASAAEVGTAAPEDSIDLWLLDGTQEKNISEVSTGQRCTAILPIVLSHKERVLIVDQPEDHIDNGFVVDTLIRVINQRSPSGQMIFSTHNANIPVLGNADSVVQMGSDGRRGFALVAGDLSDSDVVSAITNVMEGGADAFKRRAAFYRRFSADGQG